MFKGKNRIILTALLLFSIPVNSQMHNWKFIKDRDGNKYYIDKNFKIRISGKPEFKFKPVSVEGIDYYLQYGKELISRRQLVEGLTILKSILAISAHDNRAYQARVKAAEYINFIKKKEGNRYDEADEASSLLLYRDGDRVNIINEHMYYSLRVPAEAFVLKKNTRKRLRYRYYGFLLGIRIKNEETGNNTNNGYDILLAVDSEKFAKSFINIDQTEKNWKINLGSDNIIRKKIFKEEDRLIYQFENNDEPRYSGFEGIYLNKNYTYMIRAITPEKRFKKYQKIMMTIVEGFKVVSF